MYLLYMLLNFVLNNNCNISYHVVDNLISRISKGCADLGSYSGNHCLPRSRVVEDDYSAT